MKRVLKYIILSVGALTFSSCDKGFDELNTNKISATSIDPAFILNQAIISSSFPTGTVVYEMGVVQQIISPNSGVLAGANFNVDNRTIFGQLWPQYFGSVIRHARDVQIQATQRGDRNNLVQMSRIILAHAFMVATDSFGEIPYFEAGLGYSKGVFLPKYDQQDAIYKDIIKELTEASAALSTSARIETADILYAGDVAKWKKLGYTLLLRAGMRLSQVDAAAAQSAVSAAVAGGVMQSNADNFTIRHDPNYRNPISVMLNSTEAANLFLAQPFVNYLKNNNDPRLGAIAVRYVGAGAGNEQVASIASIDPSVQMGIPVGYDNASIAPVVNAAGLKSFYEYSQADRTRVAKPEAPAFLATYGQTQLLLAEAATRGWTSGSAANYYSAGIRAHMEQLGLTDSRSAIAESDIAAYLSAHPLGANALEQIANQYWVASFLNGPEAFANFRRTGFPALAPNPYPAKDISGTFINRITYPNSEISVNSENIQAAISRQGPDNMDTKVWWDK